jgi:outer membrane lipoprotein-sorting protein
MNIKFLLILFLMAVISCRQADKDSGHIRLVNPEATEKAQKLYNFIQDISGNYTLSGQHNFCGKGSEYTDRLEKMTGKTRAY